MNETNEVFEYTYSASQQEEIKKIRDKYIETETPKNDDNFSRLKRLDESVHKKGTAAALAIGTIGLFLFGFGMCCCLVWAEKFFILGIIVGIIGMMGIALANPVYTAVTKRIRKKIAPQVLQLTDELLK